MIATIDQTFQYRVDVISLLFGLSVHDNDGDMGLENDPIKSQRCKKMFSSQKKTPLTQSISK